MIIINKGMSVGWSVDALHASKTALGFQLISILDYILKSWEDSEHSQTETKNSFKSKYQGLVKEAYTGLYNDYHGLAVKIDMLELIFEKKQTEIRHKDFLYVTEVVEKYFMDIRSIYDFMAKILRLTVAPKYVGQLSFDSLNSLITSIEKGTTKDKLPESLEKKLLSIIDSFHKTREIRDSIVHSGHQINIMTLNQGYAVKVHSSEKGKPDEYIPLLPYLSEITKEMFSFGEDIARLIYEEYRKNYGDFTLGLVALEGVCIPNFIEFLGIFKGENGKDADL
ncbi:hypothetical protein OCB08_19130 [Bacillus cereus]|uniref:hypothetical protein n=2 Tax=Bacillaceae TaxID=186817 RepID=UPI0001A12024|nr:MULTISPECIES: hypothetical protein [Bacillus]EEL73519.1 hypothetical protein bcere0027_51910 [Bacillus cereus AH676]EOP99119.1 hypothetical protein IIY_05164 [Bacillus cereus VD140]KMP63799.1 hypothetical protein TU56_13875 [Bacillus cereus]KZD36294.1 hypothetical protein B4081_1946 [Bacillus cereus]MBM6771471.1 hypothetical protein [Bacillus cereus]